MSIRNIKLFAVSVIALTLLMGCGNDTDGAYSQITDQRDQASLTASVSSSSTTSDVGTVASSSDTSSVPDKVPNADELVLISEYIPDAVIDLKYATTDNFTKQKIYSFKEPSLRYGTVKKLAKAQKQLKKKGYTLLIWDAYRPTAAQKKFWDICPDPKYVSDPSKGFTNHCRGNTVDVSILKTDGSPVTMPSDFDDFSKLADRDYSDVSKDAAKNSVLLESVMTDCGFKGYSGEWWHYTDTDTYPVVSDRSYRPKMQINPN